MPEDLRQETPPPLWQQWFLPLIPALLAMAVFLPSLGNGFVNWDDPFYVYNNLHIRHLDLRWIFTATVASNYHPLTMLSHTLDYRLFGLNPAGHHLTSLILHALNSALVFLLAKGLLKNIIKKGKSAIPSAMIAALLFAVHPLHVESVAWVSEKKDVLSAFFFLLALLAYLRYAKEGNKKFYALTLIAFILALLSKPMAITLPAVLLILDYYPLKRLNRAYKKLLIEKIPFFALSLASAIITLWAQKTGGAVTLISSYPLPIRLIVTIRGYAFYLYKLIFPATLAPYYPLPLNLGLTDPFFMTSLFIFILISALCLILAMRGRRALLALWLYYLITLAPVIGIVQVGSQAVADRYAYLPTIGWFVLAGAGLGFLYKLSRHTKRHAIILTLLPLLFLTMKTSRTIPVWKDSVSLWSHEINFLTAHNKKDRLASIIAHYNRAKAYDTQGQLPEAIKDYGVVLALNPAYLDAYINRGVIYGRLGRYRDALSDLRRAIEIDPTSAAARYNRGLVYKNLGEMAKARRDFQGALSLGLRQGKTLPHKDKGL